MTTVEYVFFLSKFQKDRLRVKVYKEKNRIFEFVVQYEAEILEIWHAIVRYDTRHGFAHRDYLHADGSVEKEPLLWEDYNLALIYATQDLKDNWQKYRHKFEEEIHESR